MEWEEFLVLTAYRCKLEGAAKSFFIQVFMNESYINLTRSELAEKCCIEFKSCNGYLTTIFNKFGKDSFRRSNNKLRELYDRLQTEFQQREARRETQEEARSLIPASIDKQLHLALRTLNYTVQEERFWDVLGEDKPAQALLVRVDDLALQKWLVWRLVQRFGEIDGIDGIETEKPFRLAVKATRHWGAQPEEFWKWLAEGINCEDVSPNGVLDAIAQTCQFRSVVIAIYEVSLLKRETWNYFLKTFWQPLTERLNADYGIRQRRCLLFLTGDATYRCPQPSIVLPDELSAWETVQQQEMRLWLRNRQVQQFLVKNTDKTEVQIEKEWVRELMVGKPRDVIRSLGQEVGLEDGIDEMVRHWELGAA